MRELIGIVGAGRSRGGLGPFLAKFFEEEGFVVAGVSGRSLERATVNAETLGQQLGHEVKPFACPAALCASGVTALVICSPAEFHLEALRAAAEAGCPALCEKPLVYENHDKEGMEIIEIFSRKGLPLLENCQWYYVLPAYYQLHGALEDDEQLRVEMGLGAPRLGREMVQNSVSHLLSVIQAVAPVDPNTVVTEASVADPSYKKTHNRLRFQLVGPGKAVEALLHLEFCPAPPRPAWLAINSCRIDRQIRQEYSIAFSANGMDVAIEDPVKQVVKRFTLLVRSRDSALMDYDRDRIRQRLGWYQAILSKLS
jgi:hypothetical protein